MTDVKDFFTRSKETHNAPTYDPKVLSTLIFSVDAFARMTYQSIYLIDYYKNDFLYVSDNPLFLCGHTAMEVKDMGYSFFLKHVPENEQKMLAELSNNGYKIFDFFDDLEDKKQCYMSCDFHLKSEAGSTLINHQVTPVLFTNEGKIWIGMCIVSLSSHKTAGHVEFHKKGLSHHWKYSNDKYQWKKYESISLKEKELEVLRFSATGLSMVEIANRMCRSLDCIKYYKRNAFEKLKATNITEAISKATLYKLF